MCHTVVFYYYYITGWSHSFRVISAMQNLIFFKFGIFFYKNLFSITLKFILWCLVPWTLHLLQRGTSRSESSEDHPCSMQNWMSFNLINTFIWFYNLLYNTFPPELKDFFLQKVCLFALLSTCSTRQVTTRSISTNSQLTYQLGSYRCTQNSAYNGQGG